MPGITPRAIKAAGVTNLSYGVTSAPAIFEDLVILGFAVGENTPAAPGDIRAFDVRSGKEAWRFHTVPHPGEFGNETWTGDSWKDRGGANAWGGLTVDQKNKLVFAGLGSPVFDFYGGDRKGANLFGNSVVALDARTGKRVWHFQTVRHDIWDYDLPTPPVLVKSQGKEAVAQVTKTGHVWVLDRRTGQPLFGFEERAVPPSDVPGEETWPTQIFPKKPPPIAPQLFEPSAAPDVQEQLKKLKWGSIFTPPSLQGTVTQPGFHGGANWSGAAWDPRTGMLYVNTNNVPNLTTLVPGKTGGYGLKGYIKFTDQDGNPASKPPWGMLTAVDLNRGEIAWQKTLGDGHGSENFGGAIVTAGGLVFIASTKDEKFRAFDAATGDVLWEHKLPAGGYAAPATYIVNGKQYVTIAAGGGGKPGTKRGDSFVTFALP